MKLTYWYAAQDDHPCYHARARTKKECQALVDHPDRAHIAYGPVTKVVVDYENGFDLLEQCVSSEGARYWEDDYAAFEAR